MSIVDDTPVEGETTGGGFDRALRSFVLWLFVLTIAVGAGFAGGYVLHYQELRDLERTGAEERAALATQIAGLERQILVAEKAQLEAALARANVVANLDGVLTMLPEALSEIEQFGQAMQDLDAAETALTDAGVTGEGRDTLGTTLDGLRARLKALDLKARERIAASAKDLEHAMASPEGALPPAALSPAENTPEEPETEAPPAAAPPPVPLIPPLG